MTRCENKSKTGFESRRFAIHEISKWAIASLNSWLAIQICHKKHAIKMTDNTQSYIIHIYIYDQNIGEQKADTSLSHNKKRHIGQSEHMIVRFQQFTVIKLWSPIGQCVRRMGECVCVCAHKSHLWLQTLLISSKAAHKVTYHFGRFECVLEFGLYECYRADALPLHIVSCLFIYIFMNSGLLGFCVDSRQLLADSKSHKVHVLVIFEIFLFSNICWEQLTKTNSIHFSWKNLVL